MAKSSWMTYYLRWDCEVHIWTLYYPMKPLERICEWQYSNAGRWQYDYIGAYLRVWNFRCSPCVQDYLKITSRCVGAGLWSLQKGSPPVAGLHKMHIITGLQMKPYQPGIRNPLWTTARKKKLRKKSDEQGNVFNNIKHEMTTYLLQ